MAAEKARGVAMKWNATTIAGVRTKNFAVNNSLIDVTNDDDGSVRKALSEPGEKTVTFSCSGITTDRTLVQAALSTSDIVEDMEFVWANGNKISGDFAITNYSEAGEYKEAMTFEATFESIGAVSYAAS